MIKKPYTAYMLRPQTPQDHWEDWMGYFATVDNKIYVDVRHSPVSGEELTVMFHEGLVHIVMTDDGPLIPLEWVIEKTQDAEQKRDMEQFRKLAWQIVRNAEDKPENELFELDVVPDIGVPEWEDPEFKGFTITS